MKLSDKATWGAQKIKFKYNQNCELESYIADLSCVNTNEKEGIPAICNN